MPVSAFRINPDQLKAHRLPATITGWLADQTVVRFDPDDVLVRPDEALAHVWYLRAGLTSAFSLDGQGRRYNHDFWGPGDWAFGRLRVKDGQLCCADQGLGVQALASVEAIKVPFHQVERWQTVDKDAATFLLESLMRMTDAGLARRIELVHKSAQQRYLDLLSRVPGIEGSVSQQQIAAWLGITPVALSRIRRRLLAS